MYDLFIIFLEIIFYSIFFIILVPFALFYDFIVWYIKSWRLY